MKILQILLMVAVLASCSSIGNTTGYVPSSQEIRAIQVGRDTKSSLSERFGPPTVIGEGPGNWYYVASRRVYPGPLPTREVQRRILAIRFEGETVADVAEFDQSRGNAVPISRYTTETGGRKLSLWEQLRGNIGNFSSEEFLGQTIQRSNF